MVIIDIYGKIEKTKISDKLKVFISNVPEEWKEDIKNDMLKEIKQQKIDIENSIKEYGRSYEIEYTLSFLKKIVHKNIEDCSKYDLDSIDNCIQCLVDNMICIFFDYDYEDMPFFDWTTNCFDGRFCEEDYAEKLMHFINFIHHDLPDEIYMNCLYSSNTDHLSKSRILLVVSFRLRTEFSKWKSKHTSIKKLKEVGNRIDTIISSENDYYKLDYLMNAMYKDNSYNQNHFFKTFSLIEMILMRDKHRNLNIDSLLILFLKSDYDNDSELLAKLLRQMRNKIAHGDFQGFNKKAEEYAQKFMARYQFDYSEYSRLNWILLNTCCLLDDLLRKVLLKQLKYNLQF